MFLKLNFSYLKPVEVTDNAVGPNVVDGVGYPKISRLSLDRQRLYS
jgi:hypothetical protein